MNEKAQVGGAELLLLAGLAMALAASTGDTEYNIGLKDWNGESMELEYLDVEWLDANHILVHIDVNVLEDTNINGDFWVGGDSNFQNIGFTGSIFGINTADDEFTWDETGANLRIGWDINQDSDSYYQMAFGESHNMKCSDCYTAGFENTLLADQTTAFGADNIVSGQLGFVAGYQSSSRAQTAITLGDVTWAKIQENKEQEKKEVIIEYQNEVLNQVYDVAKKVWEQKTDT